MDLVLTHDNVDFDGFAAAAALRRIYPEAVLGLGRSMERSVRDFWALHKDRFVAERLERIDPADVRRIFVVDVRSRARLKHAARFLARLDDEPSVALHVYDHHPASEDDLVGDCELVEPVGAVTTLLVERVRELGVSIDPIEATLFALGIYADTAALTLGSTTPRDARAVAWVLERGASLSMVNRYLTPPFSDAQRAALSAVLSSLASVDVAGLSIGVAIIHVEQHVAGLAEVTSEARRLERHAAVFTVCAVADKKIEIVGRAASPLVDVGSALRSIGGGGHRGAGSAVVRGGDPEALAARLVEHLRSHPPRPRLVGDVMHSPVRSVTPELPLDRLARHLEEWGCTGVPVVSEGELRGVVSRRDVERAEASGRGSLPVASHMSSRVHTTTAETPLEDALETMVRHDIGRLPVIRGGKLVGIISRSDVLRVLYPAREPGVSAP